MVRNECERAIGEHVARSKRSDNTDQSSEAEPHNVPLIGHNQTFGYFFVGLIGPVCCQTLKSDMKSIASSSRCDRSAKTQRTASALTPIQTPRVGIGTPRRFQSNPVIRQTRVQRGDPVNRADVLGAALQCPDRDASCHRCGPRVFSGIGPCRAR